MRFNEVREFVDDALAPGRRQVRPSAVIEGRACGRNRAIDVGI